MRKNFSDRIISIILLMICIAIAIAIFARLNATAEDSIPMMAMEEGLPDTVQTINVSVQKVTNGAFVKTVSTGATVINKTKSRTLASTQAGTVKGILVREGDMLEVGDTICIVDPSKPGTQYKEVELKAIATGKIDSLNIIVGQEISSGTSMLTIEPPAELKIKAYLPEKYYAQINESTKATYTCEAYEGQAFQASITEKDNLINTSDWTFGMEFDGLSDDLLAEGMYVRISIQTLCMDNVITIPKKAISTASGEKFVYVVENDTAIRRVITTGEENDASIVVIDGLTDGETVITAGTVTDHSPVHII